MSKEEILEGNKLIAEFLGHKLDNNNEFDIEYVTVQGLWETCSINDLEYNSSWDWLMPVVDKIVNHINVNKITWLTRQEIFGNLYSAISTVNLNNIYLATTEFIKWYNQNKLNETN